MPSIPNAKNFCGGNFQDWLEVNLIDKCNAHCSWCIEKPAWHPEYHAPWEVIADAAIDSKKSHIILLGGEPTLYTDIDKLTFKLASRRKHVVVTTNGSMLTPEYADENLFFVHAVNISVHSFNLMSNLDITGIKLEAKTLYDSIEELHKRQITVRMNCNCIKSHIDSVSRIKDYIIWARNLGADKVRFSELKQDDDGFVDLAAILDHKYGLNDNPFADGCNSDAILYGMPVNFRQMCGLQTNKRVKPEDPVQYSKQVLYYDGKIYDGWQVEEPKMLDTEIESILNKVKSGELAVEDAMNLIKNDPVLAGLISVQIDALKMENKKLKKSVKTVTVPSKGCQY